MLTSLQCKVAFKFSLSEQTQSVFCLERCVCGRKESEHEDVRSKFESIEAAKQANNLDENGNWTVNGNTVELATNAFGTVEFQNTEVLSVKAEVFDDLAL